jgi:hypothetical protein
MKFIFTAQLKNGLGYVSNLVDYQANIASSISYDVTLLHTDKKIPIHWSFYDNVLDSI